MLRLSPPTATVTFLGPAGTFTEEALRSDPSTAAADLQPRATWAEVTAAVEAGEADYAFVALENSIEGTVPVTLDQLVFERNLRIVGEVILPVTQNLLALPGADLQKVTSVVSYPHALAQVRRWTGTNLPGAVEAVASSTAEAARLVAEAGDPTQAAVGTVLAAELYGLEVAVPNIEDHGDNVTRFVLAGPTNGPIPAATGYDKTSVVCFQDTNRPGSLHDILGHFAARDIDLVKLDSRPAKTGLGDYCFIIDFRGHVDDAVVADCLRELHATTGQVKFLGSYPAAGEGGESIRRAARDAWDAADKWIEDIRSHIDVR